MYQKPINVFLNRDEQCLSAYVYILYAVGVE